MRELWPAALLVVLCARAALALAPPPPEAAPAAPPEAPAEQAPAQGTVAEEEVAAEGEAVTEEEAAAPEEVEEDFEETDSPRVGYREVTGSSSVLLDQGELRASVLNGTLRPYRGYASVEVSLHNLGPAPRSVQLSLTPGNAGGRTISRTVELAPRQRLTTWLFVPTLSNSGLLSVRSQGIPPGITSIYLDSPEGVTAALVLGTERAFKVTTGLQSVERNPRLSTRFLEAREAPRELAAYTGFDAVVVDEVTAVQADAWAALEAHAATGGLLVLPRPPRDVRTRLPLLASAEPRLHRYGFGQVLLCGSPASCGQALMAALPAERPAQATVEPEGTRPRMDSRSYTLADSEKFLLPSVQAPVGLFLLLITLFTLVVGPGSVLLARRRGPVVLLVAVPAVSLVTCLSIVAWSVLVDGFSLHAARYGLVLLDRPGARAVVLGVGGYYANLSPGEVRLPALAALLAPEYGEPVELDWSQGMVAGSGFLPSRTYLEWGEVAVSPSRARLAVRRESGRVWVQNALGAPLEDGYLLLGGQAWRLPALTEGAEGEAAPVSLEGSSPWELLTGPFSGGAARRFSERVKSLMGEQLQEGVFLVRVGGAGFGPTAALQMELHSGAHLVRGTVDGL